MSDNDSNHANPDDESTATPGGADENDNGELAGMMAAAPDDVEYMFAQTCQSLGVNLDGRITLHGVSATTLYFSDRPYRLTGHVPTDEFVDYWGQGDDNFAEDPPNALLSLFEDDHVNDVVVILTDPKLSHGDLSYAVEVTDGSLEPSQGPASVFIDMIGRPMTATSVAGVRRRGRRRGRRRARRRVG
jgi:hypothetical protein